MLLNLTPRTIKKIIISLTISGLIYICFLQFKIIQYARTPIPQNADYLIILGTRVDKNQASASLKNRIDAAATYLKKNTNTIAIASGGKGPNESISEAAVIKQELMARDIKAKRIIIEDHSSRTVENIKFSKKLILSNQKTGIVVSNYFHLYRARIIAEDKGLDLYALPAKTPVSEVPKWYIREYLAISKYYLERLTE